MFRKGSRGNTDMRRGHMKQELDTGLPTAPNLVLFVRGNR